MPHHRREVYLVAIAAVLTGAACDPVALAPIDVVAGCPDQPVRGPEQLAGEPADRLIDDFEDGGNAVAPAAGRDGAWVLGTDGSPGVVTAERSSRCAARGQAAGHFSGMGFDEWGANWTALFRDSAGRDAVPYDGGSYGAISFWAAAAAGAAPPLDLPIGLTTIDNAWNGGVCSTCMDYYGKKVTLTRAWQRFVIPFGEMAAGGWGVPRVAMRRDQLVGLIIWPQHEFDVWIDDVRFEP